MSFFKNKILLYKYIFVILLFLGCKKSYVSEDPTYEITPLFSIVPRETSNIDFRNDLPETLYMNGLFYEYYYNGGGVAVGDFNNDKFPDIYFISNLKSNKMYLNKRGMKFEDITVKAGVMGKAVFPTGVTTVDINSDGWLDIYVCSSGKFEDSDKRRNELYINKGLDADGIPWFEEKGKEYSLDIEDFSTQAAFFDFDKDGDLDMFLINHDVTIYGEDKLEKYLHTEGKLSGERLYRNDNGKFVNITNESGIINNRLGFGLGLAIGDLNNDNWPDIYVSHDFSGKDHLYINNKNGTFSEHISQSMGHISNFSMGNDMVDYNNDGWLDIMTVDMVSEDNYGIKTSMSGMNPEKFHQLVDLGLHRQYMFNTLQLNNGTTEKDNIPYFSEVAHLAGVSNTDWSWAPLFFDMNNDGFKDLFIANGIKRDFRNNDFVDYHKKIRKELAKNKSIDREAYINHMMSIMPTRKKNNYFFLNDGELSFHKMNKEWALDSILTCSNGASYADFDNDGDIDIVVNNMDDYACLYKNNTLQSEDNNYLKISLKGAEGNLLGIGARITITHNGKQQIREQYLTRGFQSSISEVLHFGLGATKIIDKLEVKWSNGYIEVLKGVKSNRHLNLNYKDAKADNKIPEQVKHLFTNITKETINHSHKENKYDDFKREGLLPYKMSQQGPALAVGDINNDGLDDFFVGGAMNHPGALYLQKENNTFESVQKTLFYKEKKYEDVGAEFFDADNDGDLDLYVVSGGNEEEENSEYYQDRLYQNIDGVFMRSYKAIPILNTSGSCVKPCDYDSDGDLDLFVGGRQAPGKYPLPTDSYLLQNQSTENKLSFVNVSSIFAPMLKNLGMVTDAIWTDIDGDSLTDIIVVGEWMPITIIKNCGSHFEDITNASRISEEVGWWFSIEASDFDNDGDIDLVGGNLGLNHKYKATKDEPFEVYTTDFDEDGDLDIVLGFHNEGSLYPLRGRQCSSEEMPFIKEKFPTYHLYGKSPLKHIYDPHKLQNATHYASKNFATSYFENMGNGNFKVQSMPVQVQFSSINSMITYDFDGDGNNDILMAGNLYESEVETPRNDSGYGYFLKGDGQGKFNPVPGYKSGLKINGEVKCMLPLKLSDGKIAILVALNNSKMVLIGLNN